MAKPRPRKLKGVKSDLTAFLDIDELKAIGGNEYNIEAMSPDTEVPVCIECGGPTENHGKFEKVLIDIVSVDRKKQFARLHYYFYKYRCLNKVADHENCNALFQKQVGFISSENSKITRRYEDEVMRLAMYESLADVREDMKPYIVDGHKRDLISKPAISKLIKRWVDERDESRQFMAPAVLILYTYKSFYNDYIVVGDLSRSGCKLIEIIPSITEGEIRSFFSHIDSGGLVAVILDCDPILVETVKDIIPESKVMVDTDALRRVLRNEFKGFIYERLKRYQIYVRELFLAGPDQQSKIENEDRAKMRRLQKADSQLENAYNAYASLYVLLQKHRDISELRQWKDSLTKENKDIFILTTSYMETYLQELARFHRGSHPKEGDSIYDEIYSLNRKIETHFPISTNEIFRARMLYSEFKTINGNKWQGIDVTDLEDIIENMIITGGLEKHER